VWAAPQRGAGERNADAAVHAALDSRAPNDMLLDQVVRLDQCPRCGSTDFTETR
jgi:hypothetical protein